uniref:Uncharacterized protein n=1 Tax=Fagus sylvatica TaxID=28930 RepID=A0A2N9I2L8_FAGSY
MKAVTTSSSIKVAQSGAVTSTTLSSIGCLCKTLMAPLLAFRQLRAKATELKTINQKVKSLEDELQSWKLKRSKKCLKLQTAHVKGQGLIQGMELISKLEQDLQTLQLEINNLEMLPLMSWTGLSAAFKEL